MNYYILPKNNIIVDINYTKIEKAMCQAFLSHSLQQSLYIIETQLKEYDFKTVIETKQSLNTYEYILTNVPQSNLSVSKVKTESNVFYELMEIFCIFNISELLKYKKHIKTVHYTPNHSSSAYLLNLIRENNDDKYIVSHFDTEQIMERPHNILNDFMFFEFSKDDYTNLYTYFKNMIVVLYAVLKKQNKNGISIIKVDNIFYKWLIDILYIFTGLYDKVYIIKPYVSNIMTSERYIICKNFKNENNW